jgi:YD repeat-containing protein
LEEGNRTVHTQTITSTTVSTYAYPSTAPRAGDAANRLDGSYKDGAQTDLTWDDNGNLLAQGTNVYTWDAASLKSIGPKSLSPEGTS